MAGPQDPRSHTTQAGISISYRRSDASGHAGRLRDFLVRTHGAERDFMDVDSIRPGTDFAETIDRALQHRRTVEDESVRGGRRSALRYFTKVLEG